MGHAAYDPGAKRHPWNAGRSFGANPALKPQQVWAIRFQLDQDKRMRDRAMFDLAIDSKLRGCDLVKLEVGDLVIGNQVRSRAIVVQSENRSTGSIRITRMCPEQRPGRAGMSWCKLRRLRLSEPDRPHTARQHPTVCSTS
jgi:hypothetical protein